LPIVVAQRQGLVGLDLELFPGAGGWFSELLDQKRRLSLRRVMSLQERFKVSCVAP
jgi:antitoxin component HigA of HigAB toxin-antitoxin module